MELKSLPYVYSLMGIITVLCKGFILLCSMHKNVLSLMTSSSVLFTYFFKGNCVTLAQLMLDQHSHALLHCHATKLHRGHVPPQCVWPLTVYTWFLRGFHLLSPCDPAGAGTVPASSHLFLGSSALTCCTGHSGSFWVCRKQTRSLALRLLCRWCF